MVAAAARTSPGRALLFLLVAHAAAAALQAGLGCARQCLGVTAHKASSERRGASKAQAASTAEASPASRRRRCRRRGCGGFGCVRGAGARLRPLRAQGLPQNWRSSLVGQAAARVRVPRARTCAGATQSTMGLRQPRRTARVGSAAQARSP